MQNNQNTKGFSLIELLLSISILFILFSLANQWFLKKQRSIEFEVTADEIYDQLYWARENSRHYKDWLVYWLKLENEKYEYFKGATYTSTWVIATTELPSFLEINTIVLNEGGNEIVFEKNTGKTNKYWSFRLEGNDWDIMEFVINSQGFISTNYSET